MKQKDKESVIAAIPALVIIAIVGPLTHYNLLYLAIAGALGGLIGHLFLKYRQRTKK